MQKIIIHLVLMGLGGIVCGNQKPDYIRVGYLKTWEIVVASDAIPSEKYAAEELQTLLEKSLGEKLKIVTSVKSFDKKIFVGKPVIELPDKDAGDISGLGEEGLKITIAPDYIVITGGRPRGTLYGVYEFFEKYCGGRFLTYDHTWIPKNVAKRKLPIETFRFIPDFDFRWTFMNENNIHHAFAVRQRINTLSNDKKFGGKCAYGLISHSFQHLIPIDKYKDHPDYFMFWKGKRAVDFRDVWGGGPNPCYASQEALDIVTRSVLDLCKKGDKKNISVSCIDSGAHCQCPKCSAVNKREGSLMGSHLEFVNKVAERVEKVYPDVKIGTLAYWHTRKPPKHIKPRKNVQIQLCSIECCTLHAIDDPDCPKNVAFYNDLREWGKICNDIRIWNYNVNFTRYDMPLPNLRSIGPNVRLFRDNHAKGVFMQSAGNSTGSSMSDLKNYVISKCLWKPGRDSWRLALEFCRLHYGRSAEPIIKWLELLHDHTELSNVHYNCFPSPEDMNFTPELAIQGYKLFQKALTMAENQKVRDRVEKASLCTYRAIIETSPLDPKKGRILPKGYENVFDEYIRLVKKYNVTRPSERGNWKTFIARNKPR